MRAVFWILTVLFACVLPKEAWAQAEDGDMPLWVEAGLGGQAGGQADMVGSVGLGAGLVSGRHSAWILEFNGETGPTNQDNVSIYQAYLGIGAMILPTASRLFVRGSLGLAYAQLVSDDNQEKFAENEITNEELGLAGSLEAGFVWFPFIEHDEVTGGLTASLTAVPANINGGQISILARLGVLSWK